MNIWAGYTVLYCDSGFVIFYYHKSMRRMAKQRETKREKEERLEIEAQRKTKGAVI
jgi:hypothetical protein